MPQTDAHPIRAFTLYAPRDTIHRFHAQLTAEHDAIAKADLDALYEEFTPTTTGEPVPQVAAFTRDLNQDFNTLCTHADFGSDASMSDVDMTVLVAERAVILDLQDQFKNLHADLTKLYPDIQRWEIHTALLTAALDAHGD